MRQNKENVPLILIQQKKELEGNRNFLHCQKLAIDVGEGGATSWSSKKTGLQWDLVTTHSFHLQTSTYDQTKVLSIVFLRSELPEHICLEKRVDQRWGSTVQPARKQSVLHGEEEQLLHPRHRQDPLRTRGQTIVRKLLFSFSCVAERLGFWLSTLRFTSHTHLGVGSRCM